MKKFVLFISILFLGLLAQSQVLGYNVLKTDSVTNAVTKYINVTTPQALNLNHVIAIAVYPIAGTSEGANGKVSGIPQGSLDNTNWFDLQSSVDSLRTNAKVYLNKSYTFADANYRYYRIKCVGTGVGVTKITGNMVIKRKAGL